jgi:diguanylate cyclase (GGDEF)-like protein/PAS domain S-box-containing protein
VVDSVWSVIKKIKESTREHLLGRDGEEMKDPDNHEPKIGTVIIGAGECCRGILCELLEEDSVHIMGISDTDPTAPALEIARRHNIPVTYTLAELFQGGPDVIIDVAGTDEIASEIFKHKSHRTEVIGGNSVKVFMNLVRKSRQAEEDVKVLLKDTKALYGLSVSLMSADTLEAALHIVLGEALRTLDAPAGSIALFDETSNSMTMKALYGFPDSFCRVARWNMRAGGMTEHIIDKMAPTVIDDVKDFEFVNNKVLLEAGVNSLIAVPFRANGRRVGILYIDDYEPRHWKAREIDFVILLSVQAAVAIEKFKLIEDITNTRTYLENVLDNSADIIMTTDEDRRIVEFNKGASRILGYSKEEMVGKPVESLWIRPEERNEILWSMDKYGYVSNFETQLRAKSGNIVDINLTLSYIGGAGRKSGTVGVSKDITEKKRLERAIDERNRELQELNEKLEAKVVERTAELREANRALEKSSELKSKFIATMSHELRTPLNSILGFSELLMEDSLHPLTEKQKRYATNVFNSGSHLLQLINNILDLAKIESGKMELSCESFDVRQVISEVESVIRPLANKKSQKLIFGIADEVTTLWADRVKFKQILYNLLSNSIKFTHEGGDILVEAGITTATSEDSVRPAQGLQKLRNDHFSLTVTDTGIGISKEDQDRIFGEFEQVDSSFSRRYEGTGLGLALTKKLIELHGGDIRVESEEGKGSRFIMVMPLTERGAVSDTPWQIADIARQRYEMATFKGRKEGGPLVLVIEDDLPTSELMTLYLVQGGYRVAHAYSGEEAINRIHQLKPFAVILDIMLPGKDGWEILQEMKSDPELKEIPVIISSIIDNNELGFALGASDYLVKPVDKNSLFKKLKELSLASQKGRKTVNILCVDDDESAIEILKSILEPAGYTVITAGSGKEGIEKAVMYKPDLIVLDLMMPDVDGFEVTRVLKENPATMDIPIFILTAKDLNVQERLKLAGKVVSYRQKKFFTKADLLLHMKDLELTYPVRAGLLDEVSGLLDYSYFQIRLAQEVSRSQRYQGTFTVIMVDLDHFTEYISANGLRQANISIRKIAEFLKKSTRGSDTIVRYGIDEFAIILCNTVKEMAAVVAKRVLSYIDNYPFFGEELIPQGKLRASIALVNYPKDARAPEEIISKAHELMRRIKESGGGSVQAYE